MGGVADEREARGDEPPGDLEAEWEGFDAGGKTDRAQFRGEAVLKLSRQIRGVESKQSLGVGATLGYYASWHWSLPTGASMVVVTALFLLPGLARLRMKGGS